MSMPATLKKHNLDSGFRAAHVRVLFILPEYFHIATKTPFAYVEWLTPFHHPDPDNGLFCIRKSTRMHLPHSEVITIDRIARSCHLVPLFGRVKNPRWTSENVAELCHIFWLNHYFDIHIFLMIKARRRGCL